LGWCRLRKLPIHPELAGELWCHHWTARPPRLPVVGQGDGLRPATRDRQLALTDVLEN